jgi:hypothetical protein
MKANIAGLIFAGVCLLLAVLLITHFLTPLASGIIFAAALIALGLASRGFRTR